MPENNDKDMEGVSSSESDLFDRGLAAAFGRGEEAPAMPSVLQILQQRTNSMLDLNLDPSGLDDPSVEVIGEAEQLRDPSGRYQVLGEVGRGGMGVVYKGRDLDLGRDVAMKVLRDDFAERPEMLARFVEEAQIGGQLQHPGIVPVYELGLQDGQRPYFAMKLVKGETLALQLSQRSDLASERSRFIGIFEQICQTLAYAHARHVVHRDLKPANVMIGAFGEVQVIDWGFAKVLARGTEGEESTKARSEEVEALSVIETHRSSGSSGSGSASVHGSVIGTPAYMAPEQALGDIDRFDERADVFGLGAILCTILTGSAPYIKTEGDLIEQAMYARLDGARSRLAACGADEELVTLCLDCLSPERGRRPASGTELAKRVADYRSSIESRARQAQVRAAQWRTGLFASLVGAVAITLGLGLWATSASAAERETRRELARASEIKNLMTEMLSSVSPERASTADLTLLKEILGSASARIEAGAIQDELVAAELQTLIGRVYNDMATIGKAELHLTSALEVRTRRLGADDPATLTTAHQLARVFGNSGRLPQSEALLLSTVERRLRVLGAEAEETFESQIALARCHGMQRRFAATAKEAATLVAGARSALGSDSPLTLDALFILGGALAQIEKWPEAGEALEEVCEAYRRIHGDTHPRTPAAMARLAEIRAREGRLEEAEELGRNALEIAGRVFGVDNPRRLAVAGSLVGVFLIMGRNADAEALSAECLEGYRSASSSSGSIPSHATFAYGISLLVQAKFEEARGVLEPLLAKLSESESTRERLILECMSCLTSAFQGLGLDDQARAVRRAWQPRQLALADQPNPPLGVSLHAAASLMAPKDPELNDPERARIMLEEVCAKEEAAGSGRLWRFLQTLAEAQFLTGDSTAAIATARRGLAAVPHTADELVRDLIRAKIEKYGE